MTIPRWNDQSVKRGTKIRVALWLVQEVGEGSTFTKAALRDSFPGIEQVDRRMRDLRDHGWVIHTNKEDASLTPNELRFVKAGEEVWKPGKSRSPDTLTNKQRKEIMAADNYLCVTCGIAGGELYPDAAYETAQLGVTTRRTEIDGESTVQFVTECKRCKAGGNPVAEPTPDNVIADLQALHDEDRAIVTSWIVNGRREPTPADRLWSAYLRLPAESRAAIADRLRRT